MAERKPEPRIDEHGVPWCNEKCSARTRYSGGYGCGIDGVYVDPGIDLGVNKTPMNAEPCLPAVRDMASELAQLRAKHAATGGG